MKVNKKAMKIITLVENTTSSSDYRSKHGLCLYIETAKHKILFDLGQNDLFIENAKKKNIDIADIDTVIISHGHKDHGGALKSFMAVNSKAKIYIRQEAFEPHYIKVFGLPFSVGLEKELFNSNQIIFTESKMQIDDELFLFSDIKNNTFSLKSNSVLYTKKQGQLVSDDFTHEQNLIITENDKKVLFSGCSHSGITNILRKAEELTPKKITAVIGGFHLYNPPTKKYESNATIDSIAKILNEKQTTYYTCHCTGMKAYNQMKVVLGDKLHYLSTGTEVLL